MHVKMTFVPFEVRKIVEGSENNIHFQVAVAAAQLCGPVTSGLSIISSQLIHR
jgi:hypothetical protein